MKEYIHKINVGNSKLDNNIFMAPMAGVTDIPFRRIIREIGKPALTFTEMASTKAMEYGSAKTEKLLEIPHYERPSAVQIFGSNKHVISECIKKLNEDEEIDIIDINMGCPAPKIVKNGDGAGLLLDLKNVESIIHEAVKVSNKPITVKTRKGFNEERITAVDVAKICETNGVSMITIHGRTKEQYYSGEADLNIIKKVKNEVSIPVIGNGDIIDINSAKYMFEYTGCDGVMVARGAQGNPWLFKSIIEGKEYVPSLEELFQTIKKHIEYQKEYDNENQANLKIRKHIAWYIKGLKDSSKIRDEINKSQNIENTIKILDDYYNKLKIEVN